MTLVIPAILAKTEQEYTSSLRILPKMEDISNGWVQIDIMDNIYVQNRSIDISIIKKYPLNYQVEAHLMVERPLEWIRDLIDIPFIKRVVFPLELELNIPDAIEFIKKNNREAGVSINPSTDTSTLMPYMDLLDAVLVMSVEPGFSGQKFIVESIDRVKTVKGMYEDVLVGVDGGINNRYIHPLVKAGADYLVINSYLREGEGDENLQKIKEAL